MNSQRLFHNNGNIIKLELVLETGWMRQFVGTTKVVLFYVL